MSTAHADSHAAPHDASGHGHEAHPAHLAHHFDTPEQQLFTSKLGMWSFLATEILMFGGLFVAYAVLRHNNPDVFLWSHKALDTHLGAINTAVLLASSFTMAWGVRAAQLGQRGLLLVMLALTFLGGVGFMAIKGVEYKSKWEKHLFPGKFNVLNAQFAYGDGSPETIAAMKAKTITYVESHGSTPHGESHANHTPAQVKIGTPVYDPNRGSGDEAKVVPPTFVPGGTNLAALGTEKGGHQYATYNELKTPDQNKINSFFSIYFMMTGLHAIHVLIGMGILAWLFFRALGGAFTPAYYTPVDLGGLYWHLVDLIWIFLFPLLYLIH
jgi:cytochrome c oxidase subunit 3